MVFVGADCECERVVTESLEANSSAASTDHRACSRATRKSLEPPVKLINCHNTLSPCLVCFLSSKHGIHLKSFLFDKCNPVRVYLYCIHTVQCCIAEIDLTTQQENTRKLGQDQLRSNEHPESLTTTVKPRSLR